MNQTAIDWNHVPVTGDKGVYTVEISPDLLDALKEEAGCDDIMLKSCRMKIRDLVFDRLTEHHLLPIVNHNDHVWFGRRGDTWLITFFLR